VRLALNSAISLLKAFTLFGLNGLIGRLIGECREKYGIAEDRCVLAVSNTPKGALDCPLCVPGLHRCIRCMVLDMSAVRWVALKDAFEQVVNVAFVRLAETNAKAGAAKKRRTTDSGAEETKSDDVTAYVAVNCCGKAPADVLSELQAAHITMNGMVSVGRACRPIVDAEPSCAIDLCAGGEAGAGRRRHLVVVLGGAGKVRGVGVFLAPLSLRVSSLPFVAARNPSQRRVMLPKRLRLPNVCCIPR
jgi:hypothetical protein